MYIAFTIISKASEYFNIGPRSSHLIEQSKTVSEKIAKQHSDLVTEIDGILERILKSPDNVVGDIATFTQRSYKLLDEKITEMMAARAGILRLVNSNFNSPIYINQIHNDALVRISSFRCAHSDEYKKLIDAAAQNIRDLPNGTHDQMIKSIDHFLTIKTVSVLLKRTPFLCTTYM